MRASGQLMNPVRCRPACIGDYVVRMCGLILFLALNSSLAEAQSDSFTTAAPSIRVPNSNPDYCAIFDQFDIELNHGIGYSQCDNTKGELAWLESYHMMAYVELYRTTSDTRY